MIANRVWRWHFGQALVRSVDNFGKLGQAPSHPELLDWLATSLVADGWSLKKLHKRIMLSRTYRMSTDWNERAARHRPRKPSALAHAATQNGSGSAPRLAAGREPSTRHGDGRHVRSRPRPSRISRPRERPSSRRLYQSTRRSVYLPVLQSAVYDLFQAYDFPDPAVPNGDRAATTVAGQALFLMNGPIVERACDRLAEAILSDASRVDRERMTELTAGGSSVGPRNPTNVRSGRRSLIGIRPRASLAGESPEQRRRLAWKGLCRALLSSNEFVYVN